MLRMLVVDDEEEVRNAIGRRLRREGYEVATAESEAEAARKLSEAAQPYDVVVTDMVMESPQSGLNVLLQAVTGDIFTEVIVLTAYGNISNAVESMKRGAFDYLEKNVPGVDVYELLASKVRQAAARRTLSLQSLRKLEEFRQRAERS
ncbi:MAG: response regulator [Armatimonadetes bacterium]|nr:response regulator [Armatimonadota bacterium]